MGAGSRLGIAGAGCSLFYEWCVRADVPEVMTLAKRIEAWWPQILAFTDA